MTTYPPGGGFIHQAGVGDAKAPPGGAVSGADVTLHAFNVNTAASSAQTKIYCGPFPGAPSTTGTLVAVIDDSSSTGRNFVYDVRCPGGIYVVTTGNAGVDVTLSYF